MKTVGDGDYTEFSEEISVHLSNVWLTLRTKYQNFPDDWNSTLRAEYSIQCRLLQVWVGSYAVHCQAQNLRKCPPQKKKLKRRDKNKSPKKMGCLSLVQM